MVIPSAVKAEVSTVILNNEVAEVCHVKIVDLFIITSSQLTLVYFVECHCSEAGRLGKAII
jgi:hypothetical protein